MAQRSRILDIRNLSWLATGKAGVRRRSPRWGEMPPILQPLFLPAKQSFGAM
jgi:hypothetical protein